MKKFGTRSSIFASLCGAALMITNIACSSSSTPGGTGGSGGGSTGTGGSGATGGGAGGSTGTGGGGGAVQPALSYTFDSTIQGFKLQTYVDTSAYKNVGALAVDAAIPSNYPTVTVNTTEGSPNPGSLQITATFTDYQQYVEVLVPVSNANLMNKKLHAQVQATTAFYGGAFLYADSGTTYVYGSGSGVAITTGTWTALIEDLNTVTAPSGSAAAFDPTDIVQLGVHIYSDSAPTDGGAFASASYTFLVDTIQAL